MNEEYWYWKITLSNGEIIKAPNFARISQEDDYMDIEKWVGKKWWRDRYELWMSIPRKNILKMEVMEY